MRFISWLFQMFIFIVLLGFALKNAQPVTVFYFFGYEWQSTLVIVMLLFFSVGAGLGILATLGIWFRQRREIVRLKREIGNIKKISEKTEPAAKPVA
ncbi:MAG: LapA family protein [Gallionella sp.]|nr:LapA family protein [Gallionella sp.]MDD4946588.1 LapA family protein [Gallionella sp.]MDD5613078.1 LapA family protein [Gallionella sp.]